MHKNNIKNVKTKCPTSLSNLTAHKCSNIKLDTDDVIPSEVYSLLEFFNHL